MWHAYRESWSLYDKFDSDYFCIRLTFLNNYWHEFNPSFSFVSYFHPDILSDFGNFMGWRFSIHVWSTSSKRNTGDGDDGLTRLDNCIVTWLDNSFFIKRKLIVFKPNCDLFIPIDLIIDIQVCWFCALFLNNICSDNFYNCLEHFMMISQ